MTKRGDGSLPARPEGRHSIRVVAGRTGLSADAMRAWERRYGAVTPERSETGRRLYSDGDVERFLLLKKVIAAGRRIGDVASLTDEALRELAAGDEAARSALEATLPRPPLRGGEDQDRLPQALIAIRALDESRLEELLADASVSLGPGRLADEFLMPLLQQIGELWRTGELRPAHEHFASEVLRDFLGNIPVTFASEESPPTLVVCTPAGQLHELGALAAAVTAGLDGWRAIYLGASLPAEDIALSAKTGEARLVALSIVYPPDDPRIPSELRRLRDALPAEVSLVVGGSGAPAYAAVLRELDAFQLGSFAELRDVLSAARAR